MPAPLLLLLASAQVGIPPLSDLQGVRKWVGETGLKDGMSRQKDLEVGWGIERPAAKAVRVVSADGTLAQPLSKTADGVWIGGQTLPHGTGFTWWFEVDGKREGDGRNLEAYLPNPDMQAYDGVPKGEVRPQPAFQSKVFAGTSREWWVYVPKQYDPAKPACTMYFCDGQWARGWAVNCLDNLISKGLIPVTVAVFIAPGTFADGRSNRSYEYDTVSDEYARFLHDEVEPDLVGRLGLNLRTDPASRALQGSSSGGICAFKSAFLHPEWYSKVLSWIGSYVNLQPGATGVAGGHNMHAMVRRQEQKPIRVFLQDGKNDLDNPYGNWPLSNETMANALAYRKYDYWFVMGNGFHSDAHGRNLMPEAMRWLFRDVAR